MEESSYHLAGRDAITIFCCPVRPSPAMQDIMRCPVVASDGHTYEQVAVRQWMAGARGGPARSPLTNLPFAHGGLVPNLALRGQIRGWLEGRAGEGQETGGEGKGGEGKDEAGRSEAARRGEGQQREGQGANGKGGQDKI